MEVVLLEKVVGLGNLGDVVNVKPGYARNFLVPKGKAKRATEANLKVFAERRAELERRQAEVLSAAQALAEVIDGITVQVVRKAGVDGRLFGSVNHADLSEEFGKLGHIIHRSCIRISNGPLKAVGEYEVQVLLHADVSVMAKVAILGVH